jgi:hypothetical protein
MQREIERRPGKDNLDEATGKDVDVEQLPVKENGGHLQGVAGTPVCIARTIVCQIRRSFAYL